MRTHMIRHSAVVVIFVVASLIGVARADKATSASLPRSYGPIMLGMSIHDFERTVRVNVARCVDCQRNERHANLFLNPSEAARYGQKSAVLPGANITYQPNRLTPDSVDVYFYDGKLYRITLNGVRDEIESVRERYASKIGVPGRDRKVSERSAEIAWEDDRTELAVWYSPFPKDHGFLQIVYTDRKLFERLDAHHHKKPGSE